MTLGRRASRLVVPLLFAASIGLVHFLFMKNPRWSELLELDHQTLLKTLRLLAWMPLILFIVRFVDFLAFDVVASRQRGVRAPTLLRELVSICVALIVFAIVFSTIFEKSVAGFLASGAVLAAILGFALQDTLGNLFAGIALHLEDSFNIGDVIRAGEHMGTVEAVRWRSTQIRTFNNNLVVVPNSILARDRVEVYAQNNFNARVLQFNIDYNVPPAKAVQVLTQAVSNVDGVAREMPCLARVGGFAESAVIYEIKYFMGDYAQRDRIDAEIRKAVWYALRRNALPIPFPIRHFQKYEPPVQGHQPDADEIRERLANIDVLSPLPPEAHAAIAGAARVHTYSRGETIIRRDDEGHSMFIVHEGSVSVRVADREVAVLDDGDFFGEMALLTGETRTADVVALTDVVAVEIAKDALQPVLRDHPDLAAAISANVMERRASARMPMREDDVHHSVLSRIRSYFGL